MFTSVDPAGQFVSAYVYGGNNPIMGVDPDGRWFVEALGAALSIASLFIDPSGTLGQMILHASIGLNAISVINMGQNGASPLQIVQAIGTSALGFSGLPRYQTLGISIGTGYAVSADKKNYWKTAAVQVGFTLAGYGVAELRGNGSEWSKGFWGEPKPKPYGIKMSLGETNFMRTMRTSAIRNHRMEYTPNSFEDRALFAALYDKWHTGSSDPITLQVGVLGAHLYRPDDFPGFRRLAMNSSSGSVIKVDLERPVFTFAMGESTLRMTGRLQISGDGLTYSGILRVEGKSERWNFEPHDPPRGGFLHWKEHAVTATRFIGENLTGGADFTVNYSGYYMHTVSGLTNRGEAQLNQQWWEEAH